MTDTSSSTTTRTRPGLLDTTTCLTGPRLRENLSTVSSQSSATENTLQSSSSHPTLMVSTGSRKEPSLTSRTRDSADHAGPSPPPVPSRVLTSLPLENSFLSLKNSSLSVTTVSSRTWDAMEVLWTRLSNGPNQTQSHSKMPTHTPPALAPEEAARPTSPPTERSPFPPTPMSLRMTLPSSRPLSINSQFPLLLRPTRPPSRCTPVV